MPRHNLTSNACLVCRRKRTKCDGKTPCHRCISRGEECIYEDKRLRTKDHLRSEIERLRTEQRQGQALLRALANNSPERWDMALNRMRAGDSPETTAEWILAQSSTSLPSAFGRSPRAFAEDENLPHGLNTTATPGAVGCSALPQSWGSQAGPSRGHRADTPPARRFSFDPQPSIFPPAIYTPSVDPPRRQYSPPPEPSTDPIHRTWTSITEDKPLVQRLLDSFFASSLPYLSMVSQRHFMRDFREGNQQYCSEALVNAVLGMACKAATATSQPTSSDVSFGDAFIGEAKILLAVEQDNTNLPCIQALGVLAVVELARGDEEEANNLGRQSLRACIRLLLQTQQRQHSHGHDEDEDDDKDDNKDDNEDDNEDDDFKTERALAYCGGFSLIRLFRLLTGDLEPKTGPLFMRIYPDSADVDADGPEARTKRGVSLQMEFFTQLQHCPPLPRFISEVTEVAHTFLSYNHSEIMTAGDLDEAFNKCIRYHHEFAKSAASNPDVGADVFFALLLQPFAKDPASLEGGLPPSLSGYETPHTVCRQASEAIISLTSTYQTRYSLAYLPPFLPYMVFAAVLHQLSLATSPLYEGDQGGQLVKSPEPLSPEPVYDLAYTASSTESSIPRARASFPATRPATRGPEPLSPTLAMQTPRPASRRDSVLSTCSAYFSSNNQARRPSACSFVFSTTTSDVDGGPSPERPDNQLDSLSTFTSQPLDLVAMGSLQLESMGAQHSGAAEAARLLRTVCSAEDMTRLDLHSVSSIEPMPLSAGSWDNQSGVGVGLGLYNIPGHLTGYDAAHPGATPGQRPYTALTTASQSSP